MLANWLSPVILLAGCSVLMAEQPAAVISQYITAELIPQIPLTPNKHGTAVIFIGGLGDEISGIMPALMQQAPALTAQESRAYYHWHGGYPDNCGKGAAAIAQDISRYRKHTPAADVVLVGHSMGASMALRVAHMLTSEEGCTYIITLDPSDRSYKPIRPKSVTWWGNAYVIHSQSGHDYIAQWGGRWNKCRMADQNLCFDGRMRDEAGMFYIHDNAASLMFSRGRGRHTSLARELQKRLNKAEKCSPTNGKPTRQYQAEPEDTRQ